MKDIAAIGITNQRETVMAWNSKNGESVGRATVWRCRINVNSIFKAFSEEITMKNKLIALMCLLLSSFFPLNTVFADDYAEDRAAIMDLQGRYLFALDFRDAEAYAATFAEDGIIDWARGEIKGRKAIYEFIASGTYDPASSAEKGKWPAASRHFIANQVIRVNGNTANSFAYWFEATNNTADRCTMVLGMFGHYEDELIKIDGQWYFKKRTIYNEGLDGRYKAGKENPAH